MAPYLQLADHCAERTAAGPDAGAFVARRRHHRDASVAEPSPRIAGGWRRARRRIPGPLRRGAAMLCAAFLVAMVAAPARQPTLLDPESPRLMAVGDSITDGSGLLWAAQNWPDRLFTRRYGQDRSHTAVVAHDGQCLVATICAYGRPLTETWTAEVLHAPSKPSTVALLIGRNDLAHVTDDAFIAALHQLVDSARSSGVRVLVGTIPPSSPTYQWAAYTEPQRRRINDRIRAEFAPFEFDDAASLGDDLVGAYDSGDGVHPAWPAHVVIADSVPLWWIV